MKKFLLCSAGFLILVLFGAWSVNRMLKTSFARDAVLVVALDASTLYVDNPDTPDEEIEELMSRLTRASVINLRVTPEGKAVDPFGTPLRWEHEKQDGETLVTVRCAGPDCDFGTRDDIVQSARRDASGNLLRSRIQGN